MLEEDPELTVAEAADYMEVTRQSVFMAIRKGRLKAEKKVVINEFGKREMWTVLQSQIKIYLKDRYNPEKRRSEGQQILDWEKGRLTVSMAAEYMQCSVNKVHYLIRTGRIKSSRIGKFFVLYSQDIVSYLFPEEENNQQETL